jgi:hypothetical protein
MTEYNACFISYRHPEDPNAKRFVQRFVEVLRTQLQMNLPNGRIFFDEQALEVGDSIDKLALELCRSACLVICYGPRHFDPTHPWCTMEYLGMRRLEEDRRAQMPGQLDATGLIFPVVFRGSESLPHEVKQRMYAQFDDVLMPKQFGTGKQLQKIDALARKIYERWEQLERAGILTNHDCGQFRLPKDEVKAWLQHHLPMARTPMPGRS